jgi:predicted alpha/beta superfamily hydrolase
MAVPAVRKLIACVAAEPGAADRLVAEWRAAHAASAFPLTDGETVSFLYFETPSDNPVSRVALVADCNNMVTNDYLERVGTSRLFHRSYRLPQADGTRYRFLVRYESGRQRGMADPFNANREYDKDMRNIVRTADSPRGVLQLLENVKPEGPNAARRIWVWLPPGYFRDASRRYPVLYMHDGQQVWDGPRAAFGGWKVDTAIEGLAAAGKIEPAIVVGIENSSERTREFIGYSAGHGLPAERVSTEERKTSLALAEGYRAFLVDELKPWIDRHYRTLPGREHTAIAGASFGAGVSLYIGFTRPEVFSMIGALSGGNYDAADSSRSNRNFYNAYPWLIDRAIKPPPGMKVYLDCGGRDVDALFLPRTREMHAALVKLGYAEGKDLLYRIDETASHNEQAWAKRFPECLEFFFGKTDRED